MKKLLVLVIAIIMVLSIVTGCGNKTQVNKTNGDVKESDVVKEITISNDWGFEEGFMPISTPEISSNYGILYLANNFYETLVNYENGEVVPGLAENWEVSEDGMTYTFNLKQGIKFSDGEDFNADVVKLNLENIPVLLGRYISGFAMSAALIEEVTVVDEYTIDIRLSIPYYGFLQDMTFLNPMAMVSPNAYNEDGTYSDAIKAETLGTGPYMYDGNSDGSYRFVKNPSYHGEEPEVDVFNIKIIPTNEAKYLALRSGEIDMILGKENISHDVFNEFSKNKNYVTKISDQVFQTRYMSFNYTSELLKDINIRKALSMSIDRKSICDNLFYGIESPSSSILHSSLPYCNVDIEEIPYDVEKAKQLLKESKWIDSDGDGIRDKDGKKLEIKVSYISGAGGAKMDDLLLSIQTYAREVGIDIFLEPRDLMGFINDLMAMNFDMVCKTTNGLPYDPMSSINNIRKDPLMDPGAVSGLAHLENGDEIINNLMIMTNTEDIQSQFDLILTEISSNYSFIPISYMSELVVFDTEKIQDYSFYGFPTNISIADIDMK